MLMLAICLVCLFLGYLIYGRFIEKMVIPFRAPTPAVDHPDGMDYVPMSKAKNHLIQLLNIAGTGPIFGALMGAKWGPVVFIWIVAGTIFGGAVHDYMCGMMSERYNGKSATGMIIHFIGKKSRYPVLILMIFVLIMVSATFARSASDLLETITGIPMAVWIALILMYFVISTVLPIDKVIGRIYPVFGVLLILMAAVVIGGLMVGGYEFPSFTLDNLHPDGTDFFPDMFITVACGAISGFHATQSPMVARCIKDEKDGRMVFYGAMVVESVIAVLWATAGMAFFQDTSALAEALNNEGASGVVYDIAVGVAGPVGGILAVIGVIICPITSGDTALRSTRMIIQDDRGYAPSNRRNSIIITGILIIPIVIYCAADFTVLWNYFSWLNQTLACVMLWVATIFILAFNKRRYMALFTAVPAVFMTMVVSAFILHSNIGLGLDYDLSVMISVLFTVAVILIFVKYYLIDGKAKEID